MFESYFPVDRDAGRYNAAFELERRENEVWWNAFKRVTAGFSGTERDEMFRGTASRVYRLGVS